METLFLPLMLVALFFVMSTQKKKQASALAALRDSAKEGAEILTTSGLYGFVSAIEGDIVWLEIAEDVEVRIAKAAISKVITPAPDGVVRSTELDTAEVADDTTRPPEDPPDDPADADKDA